MGILNGFFADFRTVDQSRLVFTAALVGLPLVEIIQQIDNPPCISESFGIAGAVFGGMVHKVEL